jgi:uncharacterized protein (DUF1778 family)
MTKTNSNTSARLEARVKPEIKALWQKAAELKGRTLTDFVITRVQEAAYKVIERHEQLKLDLDNSEAFVEALLNPAQPNKALKAAFLIYPQ